MYAHPGRQGGHCGQLVPPSRPLNAVLQQCRGALQHCAARQWSGWMYLQQPAKVQHALQAPWMPGGGVTVAKQQWQSSRGESLHHCMQCNLTVSSTAVDAGIKAFMRSTVLRSSASNNRTISCVVLSTASAPAKGGLGARCYATPLYTPAVTTRTGTCSPASGVQPLPECWPLSFPPCHPRRLQFCSSSKPGACQASWQLASQPQGAAFESLRAW